MRSFIALMLGAELGEQLRARLLPELEGLHDRHPEALRIHGAADLHLTLAFLGEQTESVRDALCADLEGTFAELPAPRLRLTRPGAFPGRGRERVLWAGVQDLHEPHLAALAAAVAERCCAHGIQLETRPFRPHVTLARVRAAARGEVPDAFYEQDPALNWQPQRARWVVSLEAGGPRLFQPGAVLPLLPCGPGAG